MNHIAICSDENYMPHVAALAYSIYKHNKDTDLTIHLITNNVSTETIHSLKRQIDEYPLITLNVINLNSVSELLKIKVPDTISIVAYCRLFLAILLPKSVSKVLYLDCDIIISSSLDKMFDIHMQDALIAGCLDTDSKTSKSFIELPLNEPYFNSGVLLINLNKWREDKLTDKFLSFLHEKEGKVYHHDQGIINKVCAGKKIVLSPKFNVMTAFYDFPYKQLEKNAYPFYSKEEIEQAKKEPVILHYTPSLSNRPWLEKSKHPKRLEYIEARNKTSYVNIPLIKDNRPARLKFLSFIYFNVSPKLYYSILDLRSKIKK